MRKLIEGGYKTFNSLSRDHTTVTVNVGTGQHYVILFQLPLSGSPHLQVIPLNSAHETPELPFNSLSRDHTHGASSSRRGTLGRLSTPSLGITCDDGPRNSRHRPVLSTPSLGITGCSALRGARITLSILSTPSLGITEPYSGIFRLSAAFCRGAPSHK